MRIQCRQFLLTFSVIHDLGETGANSNLGWLIGRPILASALMTVLTPLFGKYVCAPLFRRYSENRFAQYDHLSNILLMIFVLCAFISIAAYAGTSVLFGAFLAGAFLTYIPSKHPDGPFMVMSREEGEREKDKSPTFIHTFELYFLDAQQYLMAPLFFASIGFAIPFLDLWTGKEIWRGVTYSLLMLFAKVSFHASQGVAHGPQVVVGCWIPIWDLKTSRADSKQSSESRRDGEKASVKGFDWKASVAPALLLGSAMVARGEIGLLIVQIGYNNTDYVSQTGFLTAIWAILLNTIIGPVAVGVLVKTKGKAIDASTWGSQTSSNELPISE